MVQAVSLQAKAQSLVRAQQKQTEKETTVRYTSTDLRFNNVRPPVHEDFNSFLASSTSQIKGEISDATRMISAMQNRRFGPEEGSLQKADENRQPKTVDNKEPVIHFNKNPQHPLNDISPPRILEILNSAQVAQPIKVQFTADKGYGSRIATDPLIAMATSTDLDKISMGLVGGIHDFTQHYDSENDTSDFSEPNQKSKAPAKTNATGRSENASIIRREEIEVLRDVKEKFLQQLKAQYPHITVPIKHPEGIVDIHMRFDRRATGQDGAKGSVRIMFSGSNAQVVTLFTQHRQEFMNIITKQGYAIDPSRMQFNGPSSINLKQV